MAEDIRVHPEWNEHTAQFAYARRSPFRQSPCQGGYGQAGTVGVIPG